MPYIGNSHIAGDHTNNFKVLDDISSFTATFDGSASSVINTTNNTIRVVEHRFIQGQRVTYTNGSGGNIGGLTTGTAYFVIFDTANTIKLATNASNAASSTAINLSAVGTGTSHTLNAAFDGVNKKFKLSHSGGTDARLNNASQINIAINNVVQRPNLDPNNFTDGFALEDNHKIVFQNAPSDTDIFWGSIIANTLTTFDISDHKIDTFTGDGSTTEFTLSHTPANNESLMVTINGVLQHPSNASTTRAYTLIASIIQFTAAPGVGDEIQVRHIGFAGATTADVSGFYGRTGNVVLGSTDHITTGDITARNINASGILTASSASFSGNVSIGGTLTYEDVTNIDSVGLITARNGAKIQTGTATTALVVEGDARVTGILTVGTGSITLNQTANTINVGTALTLGHTQGLQFHTQNLHSAGFEVNQINVSGVATAATFKGDGDFVELDVDGHTNLDNVSVAGVTTFASNVNLGDNDKIIFGSGNRFQIYDNGTSAIIDNSYGGGSILRLGSGNQVVLGSPLSNNQNLIRGVVNGPAELYYAGDIKFETTQAGSIVTGILTATSFSGDGSNLTGIIGVTINGNVNNRLVTATGTTGTLNGESSLTWDGNSLGLTAGTGNQFPIQIRNDFTPNSQRADYGYLANATSNNALRLGSINSNGGVTIQSTRMNDSSIKHNLHLQPDGGQVTIGLISSPSGILCVDTGSGANHANTLELRRPSSSDYHALSFFTGGTCNWSVGQNDAGSFDVYEYGSDSTTRFTILSGGKIGIGKDVPTSRLYLDSGSTTEQQFVIDGPDISGSTDMKHGSESGGGDSNSIYIHRGNSTFDWQGGMVMRGTGSTWGLRISGSGAFTTNSDTAGEIFGVHPTEPTNPTHAQSAAADAVTDAYFRVMANAKIFATVPIYQSGSRPFYYNSTAVTSNETITTTYNAMSVGNITINSGNSVTVQSGARWVIV